MPAEEQGMIKVWMDLCDKHARLLTDEEDYEEVYRLTDEDADSPCFVEDCREIATVHGPVRMIPSPKKKEGVA